MKIWAKVFTALRGSLNEAGEAVADSQAIRILEQEVRDADAELQSSRNSLADVMARQKVAEEKSASLQAEVEKYEGYVAKALAQDDETLALEIAQKVSDYETQLQTQTTLATSFADNANELRSAVAIAEQNIRRVKQQIDTIKATENVQRAQEAATKHYGGSNSKLQTAMDSLERIKERQTLNAAKLKANAELAKAGGESSLHEKMASAGILSGDANAQSVLARIRNKQTPSLDK